MPKTVEDHFTQAGAEALAARIAAVWARRGLEPRCRVEHIGDAKNGKMFVVRSAMVNGVPPKRGAGDAGA